MGREQNKGPACAPGVSRGTRSRAELLRREQAAFLRRMVEVQLDLLDLISPGPSPVRVKLRTLLGELRGYDNSANATEVAWDCEDEATLE